MLRALTLAAALALTAACASTQASSTPYQQRPPRHSADDVAVFTDTKPDRAYEEIGLIEVKKLGIGGGYGKLILRAREEAARMGADAIIVTRTPKTTENTVGTVSDARGRRGRRGGKDVVVST